MIPVKVKEVVLDEEHNPLLLLADMEEENILPVAIGFWEAQSIMMKLHGSSFPRPMTHDLMNTLCNHLGASLDRVEIIDTHEDTFFAEIYLERDSKEMAIDARPSDAVILALISGAPIYLSEEVFSYTIAAEDLVEEEDIADSDDFPEEGGPQLH